MELETVIDGISSCDDESAICAKKPWSRSSDAIVVELEDDFRVPTTVSRNGYHYFLEVAIAKEALSILDNDASLSKKVDLLIFYAENDAYPEWVFGKQ